MRRVLPFAAFLLWSLPAYSQERDFIYKNRPLSEWVRLLKDQDRNLRRQAALELSSIGPAGKGLVLPLIEALGDKDRYVRSDVARALGGIGPDAVVALDSLRTALKDRDSYVQLAAAAALWAIDRQTKPGL